MRPSVKVYFFAEGSWKLSAKNFQKPFLCRGLALGKETANDTDTVVTGKFLKHAVRSLKNQLTEKYLNLEFGIVRDEPVQEEMENLGTGALRRAVEGDIENGTICAGQIAGLVKEEASCQEIIDTIMKDAETILKNAVTLVD